MRKILTIFICLLYLLGLVGCNKQEPQIPEVLEPEEEITITLNIGVRDFIIKKKNKEVISVDDIKLIDDFETIELYYDEEYTQGYNGEEIEEDINLYLKISEGSKYLITKENEEKIIEAFLGYYEIEENLYPEILYYFGQYKDIQVLMLEDYINDPNTANPGFRKVYYYKGGKISHLPLFNSFFVERNYFTHDEYFRIYAISEGFYEDLFK